MTSDQFDHESVDVTPKGYLWLEIADAIKKYRGENRHSKSTIAIAQELTETILRRVKETNT